MVDSFFISCPGAFPPLLCRQQSCAFYEMPAHFDALLMSGIAHRLANKNSFIISACCCDFRFGEIAAQRGYSTDPIHSTKRVDFVWTGVENPWRTAPPSNGNPGS